MKANYKIKFAHLRYTRYMYKYSTLLYNAIYHTTPLLKYGASVLVEATTNVMYYG